MELSEFLNVAAVTLGTALAVGWACRALGAPSIIGYLITGILLSPSVLGPRVFHVVHPESITEFGDIGLVLLLFTIGLELSPSHLLKLGGRLVTATLLQVISTTVVAVICLKLLTPLSFLGTLVIGAGVSLSSTAIVLKVLSDRGEVHSTVGSVSTGVLLLQDVAVILFMLFLPLLAPMGAEVSLGGKLWTTFVGVAEMAVIAALARWLLPRVVRGITKHGGHEMTALLAVIVASGGAWVAQQAGWPLEIGACIAGLLLAEADVRHQLIADITPFRDLFNALFFIALGMLVDLSIVFQHAGFLAAAIIATIVLKILLTSGSVMIAGWPLRLATQLALGLCTVSEFAYVLAREAERYEIINHTALALLIPYAVGTMLVGAVLVPVAPPVARRVMNWFQPDRRPHEGEKAEHETLKNHVIIVGYGLGGQDLARVLTSTRIPYCVIEMNRTRVEAARLQGAHVLYGDAARMPILRSAGLDDAKALVIAIGDVPATRHVVAQARAARKSLYILARTNYMSEIDTLKDCGASVVIPAEFEVSIEIFSQVLKEFRIPDNILRAQIASIRAGGYSMLRGVPYDRAAHLKELLEVFATTATETYYVEDDCTAAGHSIAALGLRKATGASIIAVVRAGKPSVNPMPDFEIHAGDVLILVGSHPQLDAARKLLDGTDE